MNSRRICISFQPNRAAALLLVVIGVVAVFLASCEGEGMSGVYRESAGGEDTIVFQGQKVYITISPAPTMAGEYEMDGNKIILTIAGSGGQTMVLTRNGDTLEGGPFGKTFTKG